MLPELTIGTEVMYGEDRGKVLKLIVSEKHKRLVKISRIGKPPLWIGEDELGIVG